MIKYHVKVVWENGCIAPCIPKIGTSLLGVDE